MTAVAVLSPPTDQYTPVSSTAMPSGAVPSPITVGVPPAIETYATAPAAGSPGKTVQYTFAASTAIEPPPLAPVAKMVRCPGREDADRFPIVEK